VQTITNKALNQIIELIPKEVPVHFANADSIKSKEGLAGPHYSDEWKAIGSFT